MIFFAFGITAAIGFLVYAVVLLSGLPDEDDRVAYERAALDLSKIDRGSVLYGYSPDEARKAYQRLERYQAETNQIADPKWRRAHQGWVDFSRDRIRESEKVYRQAQEVAALKRKYSAGDAA